MELEMKPSTADRIPQVLAIVPVTGKGRVSLKKVVRDYLDPAGGTLYLRIDREVVLTPQESTGSMQAEVAGSRLDLPVEVIARLDVARGSLLAMIQRQHAVALKRLEIAQAQGDSAQVVDVESAYQVTRTAHTNPLPETLLPRLRAQHSELALQFDVRDYLRQRQTLAAWQARQLLGMAQSGDDPLRDKLVQERLAAQNKDGSWQGDIVLTARHMRELAALGMTREDEQIRQAAVWLMDRPQSAHNPGMFFATDLLVEEQADIVAQRAQGKGGRFRQIKTSEKKRVMSGDGMIVAPCGPRIMWPNALVIEALLRLGYESHDRVQTALRTMGSGHDWCECGYQHGLSSWRNAKPYTADEIAAFEQGCIAQYRYGGFRSADALQEADLAHRSHSLRIAHEHSIQSDEYRLRMPDHIQGCEFITTRAMSRVTDPRLRQFAEAHLWRFAGIQRGPDGVFPQERYGTGFGQIGILQAMARYDCIASKVVVMRALPWIVTDQNEDGSWGEEPRKDVSTLSVLEALLRLGDLLPVGMVLQC
jgi:hypothetical protein